MDKKCRNKECNVDLIVGENFTQSRLLNSDYICKQCYYLYNRKYTGASDMLGRPIKHDNNEQRKKYRWLSNLKQKNKIPPAVYCWKHKDKIIYIGESNHPNFRKAQHLTKGKSNVTEYLKENKDEVSFHVLEYIDDKKERQIREFELVYQYKPSFNYPYFSAP